MKDKLAQGGKKKMKMTGFRLWPDDLERAKEKAGLVPLSKYLRTLALMWLNDEIQISEEDIKKYDE